MVAVVIQCAAGKRGASLRNMQGIPVSFVAHPSLGVADRHALFAHPDDPSHRPKATWRDMLAAYNADFARSGTNPLGLCPAYVLYTDPVYRGLEQRFGIDALYILSAGWGLLRAGYLTPDYDITFSHQAEPINIRGRNQLFHDHRHIPEDVQGPVIFIGGMSYLPQFLRLTETVRAPRRAFFNSAVQPQAERCRMIRFETTRRTNWHYSCAQDLIAGRLDRWLAP